MRETSIATPPAIAATPRISPTSVGQPQHARARRRAAPRTRPAGRRTARRAPAPAAAGAAEARSARPGGRGSAPRAAPAAARRRRRRPSTTLRPFSASKAATMPAHSASSSRSRRTAARSAAPARRRSLVGVGAGPSAPAGTCSSTTRAGLGAAGPVDEQPVRRRAGQAHRARVGLDVGRRLQVGGDARRRAAGRAGARRSGDRRRATGSRARRPGRCPVVPGAPVTSPPPRDSPRPAARARAPGSSRPSRRRSPGRRCRGSPRGSCPRSTTSVVSVLEMPSSSTWRVDRLDDVVLGAVEDDAPASVTRARSARVAAHSERSCIIARVGSLG